MKARLKSGDTVNYKGKQFTIDGIRYVTKHGKYFTNESIAAEIWVTGKRKATYHGYIYTNGTIYLLDQNGSEEIRYKGDFGYDGETGTTFIMEKAFVETEA